MSSCPNSNLVPRARHCLRTFGDNNSGAEICHDGDEDHDHHFAKHECSSETTLMELKISSNETLENFICFNITLELLLTLIPIKARANNEKKLQQSKHICY